MAKASRKQNTLVIAFAVAVICASIFLTLYAAGVLFGPTREGDRGYQNVTFNDAALVCRDSTRSSYGEKIRNLVIDSHSSRFDERQYLYKIFLKMDLYNTGGQGATLHYVNCFVRSSNGSIRKYEVYREEEESGSGSSQQSDDTNMFGMPKPKN